MNYGQARAYAVNVSRSGSILGLDSIENLMHELGDIQERLKIIHIAGTNGKGSVCAYLDAMLRAEGKSTGLFTSPHLVKMNERIVLNGKQISWNR